MMFSSSSWHSSFLPTVVCLALCFLHGGHAECETPYIEYGFVAPSRSATKNIYCKPGFILRGPSNVTCYEQSYWSRPGFCYTDNLESLLAMDRSCRSDDDCPVYNSFCLPVGDGCTRCRCADGHGYVSKAKECRKLTPIGRACTYRTDCFDPRASCIEGKCQCENGYVRGTMGYNCERPRAVADPGEDCWDDRDCRFGTRCLWGKCTCPVGMRLERDYCVFNRAGMSCINRRGCANVPNTRCIDETCQCESPFRLVEMQVDSRMVRPICMHEHFEQAREGEACSTHEDSYYGIGPVCRKPLVCEKCGKWRNTCVSVENLYVTPPPPIPVTEEPAVAVVQAVGKPTEQVIVTSFAKEMLPYVPLLVFTVAASAVLL